MFKPVKPLRKISPGDVLLYKQKSNVFYFYATNTILEITVHSDKVIRFRYSQDGDFHQDFSYAVMQPELPPLGFLNIEENDKFYIIYTFFLHCYISKETLEITIYNTKGELVLADKGGYSFQENKDFGGYNVYCKKVMQTDENFYGLGDKPTDLNLKWRRFVNWCADTPAYSRDQDPLYRAIPFYMGLVKDTAAYGVFFDNTFKTFFDFGLNESDTVTFWAEGGEMNYYFIYGPELLDVSASYTCLTGKAKLPPLWALGFQQCKWSYFPEAKVKDIANKFRKEQIPCDAIYLDIDYMDQYKCFTWNETHFPSPQKMVAELKEMGFKLAVIIDPGIKIEQGYEIFDHGKAGEYFCKRADGPYMKGTVWPGQCYFPDFTDPSVRIWWGRLFAHFVKIGIEGFWNDMNEPAVFETGTFPLDVRHMYEGLLCSHRRAHNVYGMQMARATSEGLRILDPKKRKLVISRAGYSGVQKYAAVWTGDNMSTWEHLWLANVQCQRLSISGLSFCGSDVGGFIGQPNGELFARWVQTSIFHPFFRAHATSEFGDKEPWVYDKPLVDNIRKFIELRYQLLPYIYTTFRQYVHHGTPMIRPLVFLDQFSADTWYRQDEFGLGDLLLICPISAEGSLGRVLFLPKGNWYYYFSDQLFEGRKEHYISTSLHNMPLFVKAGGILPHWPVQQYVDEIKITTATLHIYYNPAHEEIVSELYEDDYVGYDYQTEDYLLRSFSNTSKLDSVVINQFTEGTFESKLFTFDCILHGFPPIHYIIVDENEIKYNVVNEQIHFSVSQDFSHCRIEFI